MNPLPSPPHFPAPDEELLRQQSIGLRPLGVGIVLEDAPPFLRRFGEPGVDADFDGEDEGAGVGAVSGR